MYIQKTYVSQRCQSFFFSLSVFSSISFTLLPSPAISLILSDAHDIWWQTKDVFIDVNMSGKHQSSYKVFAKQLPDVVDTVLYTFLLFVCNNTVVSHEIDEDQLHHSTIHLRSLRFRRRPSCPLPFCGLTYLWTDDQDYYTSSFALWWNVILRKAIHSWPENWLGPCVSRNVLWNTLWNDVTVDCGLARRIPTSLAVSGKNDLVILRRRPFDVWCFETHHDSQTLQNHHRTTICPVSRSPRRTRSHCPSMASRNPSHFFSSTCFHFATSPVTNMWPVSKHKLIEKTDRPPFSNKSSIHNIQTLVFTRVVPLLNITDKPRHAEVTTSSWETSNLFASRKNDP